MAYIEWRDEFNTGIASIDAQHRRLVRLINELDSALLERRDRELAGSILSQLTGYARTHFDQEERLFAEHGYPAGEGHCAQHDAFTAKVTHFQEESSAGRPVPTRQVLRYLRQWLVEHILESDMRYVPFLRGRGVD